MASLSSSPGYVELHARSAFSFLRGASLPEELTRTAAGLGLPALAVCDRMGLYGAPRVFDTAREQGIRAILGAELAMEDGSVLPVLVRTREGYRNLCRLLSQAHLRAAKNEAAIGWDELPGFTPGLVALTGDLEGPVLRAVRTGRDADLAIHRIVRAFGEGQVYAEVQRQHLRGESRWNRALQDLAAAHRIPLLATGGVTQATPEGREVLDVFACLRHHTHLDAAGTHLSVNGEASLKPAAAMARLFGDLPKAVAETVRLADRLEFTLEDLGYEFPRYPVGPGETMEGVLRDWALRGARGRYGGDIPERVLRLLDKELALIGRLGFSGYFLIVADIVRFCRDEGILAQGRGSAANSAVCFCLGITAVDPLKFNVLFERFLSESRKGWPDIDIDLPSGERRERVIQEVYRRYGRHSAAMTGTVITYRGRSAAREIGKALNLPADVLDRFSSLQAGGDFPHTLELEEQMRQAGLPAEHPRAAAFARLCRRMRRLPRHLGQHSGGMILCQGELTGLVPLENASMAGRVVAQWDKDDCEGLGIIKVDLLGLGMMAALQDTIELANRRGRPVDLAQLPKDDPSTYALLQRADTVGVFQVESRAQMATLPRLKPACFYDLVVEVAIIRPGPIQGDLAHPYLRRRGGLEPVRYLDPRLEPILSRTLGVPLFQEQMLEIAMVMADFSGDEAENLRKALSFHRSDEKMAQATVKLREAMARKGVAPEVIDSIARTVGSFALYGFPESHAISFALLAYASAYLKVHRAPEFYAALLNNQPMGFYSPATLLRDAKAHGVAARPVCAARSDWETRVEADGSLRLGLCLVQGLPRAQAASLLAERERRPFASLDDLKARTTLGAEALRALASIGALNAWSTDRRSALWHAERPLRRGELPGQEGGTGTAGEPRDPVSPLARMSPDERLAADYATLRLTTGPHPMALRREGLRETVWRSDQLREAADGTVVRAAGQVICRQRPGTAKGVCFVSLEDEAGITNVIVSPELFEAERLKISTEPFLQVEGVVQRRHGTVHLKALRLERLPDQGLRTAASHDFG